MSDLNALMELPIAEYEACDYVSTCATSISMVRYKSNDYTVLVAYAHHDVQLCGFVHEIIEHHNRSYAKPDMIFDPLCFLYFFEQ